MSRHRQPTAHPTAHHRYGDNGSFGEGEQKGLIDVIEPLLMELRANGMYLGDAVINDALRQAGEID